jgi:glycolate oxidase FAD binding subunit
MTTTTLVADMLPGGSVSDGSGLPGLAGEAEAAGLPGPECIAHPSTTDEVARLLAWATAEGIGVVPVSSGARVRFGATRPEWSEARWIALSTDRLSGVEIYEAADLTITAGAGTPMATIDAELRRAGQWLPFDPPLVLQRSLGGLVADGASGPMWMGYGELRNHVLGMTVVTGDGRVLRLGGRVVKNVAGFDLVKPMTGSRGTLAVITSACLRTFPEPVEDRLLLLRAPTVGDLLEVASAVGTAPVLPVSSVIVDGAEPGLLVRLHGAPATVDSDQRTLETHVGRAFDVPSAAEASAMIEDARDRGAALPVSLEVSVLPSNLAPAWAATSAAGAVDTVVDTYGGRLRAGFRTPDATDLAGLTRAVEAVGGVVRVVRGRGAPTSASSALSPAEVRLTEGLFHAFDPEGVFWPTRP